MDKQNIIMEIVKLYDENQKLKNTVMWLERELDKKIDCVDYEQHIQDILLEEGKKAILSEVLSFRNEVKCFYNSETGNQEITSYDDWIVKKVYGYKDFFKNIAYNDFLRIFRIELYKIYECECELALQEVTDNESSNH